MILLEIVLILVFDILCAGITHTNHTRLHCFLLLKHMSEQMLEWVSTIPHCTNMIKYLYVRVWHTVHVCIVNAIWFRRELNDVHCTCIQWYERSFFPHFLFCFFIHIVRCSVFTVQSTVVCRSRHLENRSTKCVNMNTKFLREKKRLSGTRQRLWNESENESREKHTHNAHTRQA